MREVSDGSTDLHQEKEQVHFLLDLPLLCGTLVTSKRHGGLVHYRSEREQGGQKTVPNAHPTYGVESPKISHYPT